NDLFVTSLPDRWSRWRLVSLASASSPLSVTLVAPSTSVRRFFAVASRVRWSSPTPEPASSIRVRRDGTPATVSRSSALTVMARRRRRGSVGLFVWAVSDLGLGRVRAGPRVPSGGGGPLTPGAPPMKPPAKPPNWPPPPNGWTTHSAPADRLTALFIPGPVVP